MEEALFADVSGTFHSKLPPAAHVSRNFISAEREWLQEDQLPSSSSQLHPPNLSQSTERFDWRLRAASRANLQRTTSAYGRTQYIRRKQAPLASTKLGEPFYDAIKTYEYRFLGLLGAEQAEDEAVLKERLSRWTLDRLREEGYCLTGLSAYRLQENQFGRPVASFLLGPGLALPDHRFENGTQVLISRIDPLIEDPIKGSVISRTTSRIQVSFSEQFDLDEGEWRLDVGRSNIIYERMRTAISHFHHNPQQQEAASASSDQQLILHGTYLRDVLLRTFDPPAPSSQSYIAPQSSDGVAYFSREALEHENRMMGGNRDMGAFREDMLIQSWAKRYAEVDPVVIEGDPILVDLNPTQKRAIAMMIGQRISLVQGPPGTGKTKTIIEAVKLLKVHFEVPQPILICTYTNVAVDNLVEGLTSSGVKALRVSSSYNVRPSILNHTLDHKLEMHRLQRSLGRLLTKEEGLSVRMADLAGRLENLRRREQDAVGNKDMRKRGENMRLALLNMENGHRALKSKIYAMQQEMLRDVICDADVICTTCITSACVALNATDFPVVFLDEASMSTEPASLIPIMKGSRHIALIGDHKQLPPIITSREAQALGLGVSLFERLADEGVVPSIMLDTQYRMHPSISCFPSSEFYNFSLQDGTVDSVGIISPALLPPSSRYLQAQGTGQRSSVIFLDHVGIESMKDRSRVNITEAHIVTSVVEDLLLNNPQLQGKDIGIIAPYVAQISLLTRLLNNDMKYKIRFKEVLGDYRVMQLANIEIKTVDGFEGREKEVIIFSTVRNNPGGYLGFLADRRRLNVGLTRARRGLFVVGSIDTLKTGTMSGERGEQLARVRGAESWQRYVRFLTERGLVVKLSGDTLKKALYGKSNATETQVTRAMNG